MTKLLAILLVVALLYVTSFTECKQSVSCPSSVADPSSCKFGAYTKRFTINNRKCPEATLCCEEPVRDEVSDCLEWTTTKSSDGHCVKAYHCTKKCPKPTPKDSKLISKCRNWIKKTDNSGCHVGYECTDVAQTSTVSNVVVNTLSDNNCPDPESTKEGQCCSGANHHFVLITSQTTHCPVYTCQCKPKDIHLTCSNGQTAVDLIDSEGCEYRTCQCIHDRNKCPDNVCDGKFGEARVSLLKNFDNHCITECSCQITTRKCLSDVHIGDTKTERQCCTQTKSYDLLQHTDTSNLTPEITYDCEKTICETLPITTNQIQFTAK